jgi:hypothetical protein
VFDPRQTRKNLFVLSRIWRVSKGDKTLTRQGIRPFEFDATVTSTREIQVNGRNAIDPIRMFKYFKVDL